LLTPAQQRKIGVAIFNLGYSSPKLMPPPAGTSRRSAIT
jgi:hypothetical protein